MKNKNALAILTLLIITISITVSYAYMRSTLNNNQNMQASVVTGTMRLTFSDGTTGQVLASLNMGDSSTPKDLVLENTGTLPVSGTISWNNLTNTYLPGSLTYVLNRKTSLAGSYTKVAGGNVPVGTNIQSPIYAEKDMPSGAKYYYQLIVTLNSLPTVDQTADAEAQMKTSFTVLEGVHTLADISLAHLVNTTVQETPTTYNMFNYTYNGYKGIGDVEPYYELVNDVPTTEGLYAMDDDFGTSYYFRGSNNLNNVVKFGKYQTDMYYYPNSYFGGAEPASANPQKYVASFLQAMGSDNAEFNTGYYSTGSYEQCMNESISTSYCSNISYKYASAGDDMYWRILRINGDGTVRLLYVGTEPTNSGVLAGRSPFNNEWNNNPKYSGYTFDNSAPDAGDGTSSDIKKYLETWYERVLINLDFGVAVGQYFYDSSGYARNDLLSTQWSTELYAYSSMLRLEKNYVGNAENVAPKLTTHSTTETYGGIYNSKVGLANIDELVLSGYDGLYGAYDYGNRATYPYSTNTSEWYWAGSPAFYGYGSALVFRVYDCGRLGNYYVNGTNGAVAPVINLTTEAWMQMIGEGSVSNPYIESDN